MTLRTTSYAILLVAACACGTEEAFEPQLGSRERLLEAAASTQLDSGTENMDTIDTVGDLDGDGIDDAVVTTSFGYFGDDGLLKLDGNLYILYGGAASAGKHELRALPYLAAAGFDLEAAGIGDVNGDGLADLLVTSARSWDCRAERRGAWLVYGSRTRMAGEVQIASVSTLLRDNRSCVPSTGSATPTGPTAPTRLGDVDGDGVPDFALLRLGLHESDPRDWLVFYGRGAPYPAEVDLATADAQISTPSAAILAGVGDVDGDGYADLTATMSVAGDVQLIRGSATRLTGAVAAGAIAHTVFHGAPCASGNAAAGLGDLDGDGADDFALVDCDGEILRTSVDHLFYGRKTGFPAEVAFAAADATVALTPDLDVRTGNLAGGDVDGDGLPDLVVGDGGLHDTVGGVHVVPGDGTRLTGELDLASRGLTYVGKLRHAPDCSLIAAPDCIVHPRVGYDLRLGDLTGDHRLDVLALSSGSITGGALELEGSALDRVFVLSPETTIP